MKPDPKKLVIFENKWLEITHGARHIIRVSDIIYLRHQVAAAQAWIFIRLISGPDVQLTFQDSELCEQVLDRIVEHL